MALWLCSYVAMGLYGYVARWPVEFNFNNFGTISGPFCDHSGMILKSFWDHLGNILGSCCGHSRVILGSFWDHVGTIS